MRWVARSHYQRYGSDHGARRAKELVQDGYAGERQDGDPLRYQYTSDGATEWYRLDRKGRRVVVRREEQWERLGFKSAEHFARWQRR